MAWTAPRTWVTGEVVSAAQLNAHVRDNMLETAPAKAAAAGDLFYATAANAAAVLPIGTSNYRLRSTGSAPQWRGFDFIRKSADETVTASEVLQNDDELLFAVGANENWAFEALIIVDSPSAADIRIAFSAPAAATSISWSGIGLSTAAADDTAQILPSIQEAAGSNLNFGAVSGNRWPIFILGTLENGANAGNLQMQWAQLVSDGTGTKVKENSWLRGSQI